MNNESTKKNVKVYGCTRITIFENEIIFGKIGASLTIWKPFCYYVAPDDDIEKILQLFHAEISNLFSSIRTIYCSRYK